MRCSGTGTFFSTEFCFPPAPAYDKCCLVPYKRDDGKRWYGPGKVDGQLETGSRHIRCTTCRVIKVPLFNASNENSDQTSNDKYVNADKCNLKKDISDDSELDISSGSDIDDTEGSEEQNTNRTENSTDAIAPRKKS